MDITTLFCEIDDFYKKFMTANQSLCKITNGDEKKTRNRSHKMSPSEIMTISVYFQVSGYRNFKIYYLEYVAKNLIDMFPKLLSYTRFVAIKPKFIIPLAHFLKSKVDKVTGISFIDSTKLDVCNNKRISRNKVFKDTAEIGKSSMGWFYGFKLHIITNHLGGLLSVKVTPGNVSDNNPVFDMAKELFGKLFGDKGYISKKLTKKLKEKGVDLITSIKKNMKNKFMDLKDKILLRKRSIIETINDQLKNIYHINHTRHRSVFNFIVNLLSGLIAYTYRETKPSISDMDINSFCDTSFVREGKDMLIA